MQPAATKGNSDNIDQILWSRIVFGVCAALGVLPFFGWPLAFFTASTDEPTLQAAGLIVASLTTFPACVLAFWHRKAASIWLAAAALFWVSVDIFGKNALHGDWFILGPLAVAGVFGLTSSALHWPPLIKNKNHIR